MTWGPYSSAILPLLLSFSSFSDIFSYSFFWSTFLCLLILLDFLCLYLWFRRNGYFSKSWRKNLLSNVPSADTVWLVILLALWSCGLYMLITLLNCGMSPSLLLFSCCCLHLWSFSSWSVSPQFFRRDYSINLVCSVKEVSWEASYITFYNWNSGMETFLYKPCGGCKQVWIYWDSDFLSFITKGLLHVFSVLILFVGAALYMCGRSFSACFSFRINDPLFFYMCPLVSVALLTPSLRFCFIISFLLALFLVPRNNMKWKFILSLLYFLDTILFFLLILKSPTSRIFVLLCLIREQQKKMNCITFKLYGLQLIFFLLL